MFLRLFITKLYLFIVDILSREVEKEEATFPLSPTLPLTHSPDSLLLTFS